MAQINEDNSLSHAEFILENSFSDIILQSTKRGKYCFNFGALLRTDFNGLVGWLVLALD